MTEAITVPIATTDDLFLGGALRVLQPAKGYRAGLDAVLLAAAVPELGAGGRLLDAGAGVGVVGLCVARRLPMAQIVLAERSPVLAELARANIDRNGLGDRMIVEEVDIARGGRSLADMAPMSAMRPASFDHVVANPPYHRHGRGSDSPDPLKAGSHAMPEDELDGWVRFMAAACQAGGQVSIIHRAEVLGCLLSVMAKRFGGIRVLPIQPRCGVAASRVLLQGTKGSRAPLSLLSPMALHGDDGAFTPEVDRILRSGASLEPMTKGATARNIALL